MEACGREVCMIEFEFSEKLPRKTTKRMIFGKFSNIFKKKFQIVFMSTDTHKIQKCPENLLNGGFRAIFAEFLRLLTNICRILGHF